MPFVPAVQPSSGEKYNTSGLSPDSCVCVREVGGRGRDIFTNLQG